MGIGDWGLGIGDWGLGPIPNPHYIIFYKIRNIYIKKLKYIIHIYLFTKLISILNIL